MFIFLKLLKFLCFRESKISAYADDLTDLIRGKQDIQHLKGSLEYFGKASVKVNWTKSDALKCGQENKDPSLPGDCS